MESQNVFQAETQAKMFSIESPPSHFKRVVEEQSNSIEFLEAIYTTCVLLHVETSATDESALYLLDLVDSVQGIAITNMNLSTENRGPIQLTFEILTKILTKILTRVLQKRSLPSTLVMFLIQLTKKAS